MGMLGFCFIGVGIMHYPVEVCPFPHIRVTLPNLVDVGQAVWMQIDLIEKFSVHASCHMKWAFNIKWLEKLRF